MKKQFKRSYSRLRFMSGYQDTRRNREDLALTPYIFGVKANYNKSKVIGIGICWIYYAIYIGIGINIPKKYPWFYIHK